MSVDVYNLRRSAHKDKHQHEKWNQDTILTIAKNGEMRNQVFLPGRTADVLYGTAPDGNTVGMILSKEKEDGSRVIITAFQAPSIYWKLV